MDDYLERWVGDDGFVECIGLRNVFDNGKVELIFGCVGIGGFDSLRFLS